MELRRTYLIQRLRKPHHTDNKQLAALGMAFGGIGTMTKEQWEYVSQAFQVDYMGAAEFEFGALPKSWHEMVQHPLSTFEMEITEFATNEWERSDWKVKQRKKNKLPPLPPPPERVKLYVICREDQRKEVEERIRILALGDNKTFHLHESTRMSDAFDPFSDHDREYQGWYELDNGFFWFTDKDMFEKTKPLFGLGGTP